MPVSLDVTNPGDVKAAVERGIERFGRLDGRRRRLGHRGDLGSCGLRPAESALPTCDERHKVRAMRDPGTIPGRRTGVRR